MPGRRRGQISFRLARAALGSDTERMRRAVGILPLQAMLGWALGRAPEVEDGKSIAAS